MFLRIAGMRSMEQSVVSEKEKIEERSQRKLRVRMYIIKTEQDMISIAIDGPSGVGKSTIAKLLAEELNYTYIDTGAMFRALSVYCLDNNVSPEDEKNVTELTGTAKLDIEHVSGVQHMIVNGTDVTDKLRTEKVSQTASVISQYPEVRSILLKMQRAVADRQNVIMDGRDIGTVVLPNAKLKVFLTASAKVRAERRYKQLQETGKLDGATLKSILEDLEERDYRDSHRAAAPLKAADDAVIIDTSELDIEEVKARILEELA